MEFHLPPPIVSKLGILSLPVTSVGLNPISSNAVLNMTVTVEWDVKFNVCLYIVDVCIITLLLKISCYNVCYQV